MEQEQPSAEGLRYRKKLKARLAVERSALELVIERGYDGVTVEDICARAEISKKTFFNYFSSKAAAIMGRMDSFPDDERLAEILEEHDEACYLDVLVGVVGTSLASGVDESIVSLRREALRSMPQLFFQGQRDLLAVQRSIAAALRTYLVEHPERRMLPDRPSRKRRSWRRPRPSAWPGRAPCCTCAVTWNPRRPTRAAFSSRTYRRGTPFRTRVPFARKPPAPRRVRSVY